ncbi:cellulose-binding domain-containing protein [Saccharothrix sp. MB29]|nr:cellulose-binding domain-containing protein [Saccharothrix sp. MB29]
MRRTHASAITAGVVAHAFTATPMTVTPLEGGMHLHRHRSRLAAAAAVTAAVAGGGVVAAHDAAAATGCSVAYSVATQWQGGFTANVSVKNTGTSAVNGWQLAWDVPAGQGISQAWSADVTVASGKATARGASWNQNIQPGQTVSFGFNGTSQGTPANPVSFTLGGATCATA